MSGSGRDDWDDRRLDAAFQARFDQPAPAYLRERIGQEIAASTAPQPLLQSFRAVTRTAIAAIALFVALIATVTISGVGPSVPPRTSASAQATTFPTTPPLIGTVGAPFPSSIRPSGSDATYAVLSVGDAAAIRDRGVDDREIAVAGWYVPPRPDVRCAAPPPDLVKPLEGWCGESLLLGSPEPIGPGETSLGPSVQPATDWRPASSASSSTAVVFIGHFDDSRATRCPTGQRRLHCQDRFVVDTVAWDDSAWVANFPVEIDGLPVISVSQAIINRETDLSGELAIAGWYQEPIPRFCAFIPPVAVPSLEGDCAIARRWFMEAPESILQVPTTNGGTQIGGDGPLGPAINPVFPTVGVPPPHPLPVQGGSTPTKAILIGHFNDARASLCSRDAPQTCLGRFVVDAVPWVEGVERALPERTDSRAPGAPRAPVDLFEVMSRVTSIRSVLNVAAVGPDELVRLWPAFELSSASHSEGDSFWIVTLISDDRGDGAVSTYVVDAAGSLFEVTGNSFAVLDPGSPLPS